MPIARIRTFDPEAVSFLASKLAASGFQLQFANPNETDLEEVDLEITVTRMDSETALEHARLQAEEMDVDVQVMPGVFVASEPEHSAMPDAMISAEQEQSVEYDEETEIEAAPVLEERVAPTHSVAPWTTPYHADLSEPPSEAIEAQNPEHHDQVEAEPIARQSHGPVKAIRDEVRHGAELLGNFVQSSSERLADWRRRTAEARERRISEGERELAAAREEQTHNETLAMEVERRRLQAFRDSASLERPAREAEIAPKPQLVPSAPARERTLYGRDRRYARAAIAAALVIAGAMIGWGIAGVGGPASPIRSNLSNVQQQTPFGSASVGAPVQSATPAPRPPATSKSPAKHIGSGKPIPTRPARSSRTATAHRSTRPRHTYSANDEEVVVRHFGAKPQAQQAKAKTKDGVKVISEE
jgi:hypothetical protein